LDYCCSLWAPYRKGDIEGLEKIKKRATKSNCSIEEVGRSVDLPINNTVSQITTYWKFTE